MKITTVCILCILFAGLIPGTAFAQDPKESPKKEASIEELYLSNPGLQIAYEAARSDDRDTKLLAISQINELLDEGVSSDDETNISIILRDLSSQGTTVRVLEKGRLINYYPDVRREACRVLAAVKSEDGKKEAVKILSDVLRNDDDPIVKAHAAYALGVIGMNENNDAVNAISKALEIQDMVAPNDNFAYSGTLALEKISKANNGVSDARSLKILVRIAQGNYNRAVKNKALQVLKELRTQSK
jgi:HEAT repeat protein